MLRLPSPLSQGSREHPPSAHGPLTMDVLVDSSESASDQTLSHSPFVPGLEDMHARAKPPPICKPPDSHATRDDVRYIVRPGVESFHDSPVPEPLRKGSHDTALATALPNIRCPEFHEKRLRGTLATMLHIMNLRTKLLRKCYGFAKTREGFA